MPEHRIRLRGGWLCIDPVADGDAPLRVTLPLAAFPENHGRVVLFRSFQAPPIDVGRETLWLALEEVPGLTRISLNSETLQPGPLVRLGENLPTYNRLVFDVDTRGLGTTSSLASSWGLVALVIRRDDDPVGTKPE